MRNESGQADAAHHEAGQTGLARTTISVTIDNEREVLAVSAWLNRWGRRLRLSDNKGCGCCVDIWDVQGPKAALDELPATMRGEVVPG